MKKRINISIDYDVHERAFHYISNLSAFCQACIDRYINKKEKDDKQIKAIQTELERRTMIIRTHPINVAKDPELDYLNEQERKEIERKIKIANTKWTD